MALIKDTQLKQPVNLTGSLEGTASYAKIALTALSVSGSSYTGSLQGSASYADSALSASFAVSSSRSVSSSYANIAVSSSYANTSVSSSYANIAVSASYTVNSLSASFVVTASHAKAAESVPWAGVTSIDDDVYTYYDVTNVRLEIDTINSGSMQTGSMEIVSRDGIDFSLENDDIVKIGTDNHIYTVSNVRMLSSTRYYAEVNGGFRSASIAKYDPVYIVKKALLVKRGRGITLTEDGIEEVIIKVDELIVPYLNSTNNFTGSQYISGSLTVSGFVSASSFTGSLLGTASNAINSATASFAPNYVLNSATSSFISTNQTSSFVNNNQTSSFVNNNQTSSFVNNNQTSSFVNNTTFNSFTSSYNNQTSSFVINTTFNSFTSSYNNQTSSFVNNNQTSSFVINTTFNSFTSSYNNQTSSFVINTTFNSFTSSYRTGSFTGSFTGSLLGTASNSTTSSYALNATSSSFAVTSSFATTALSASVATNAATSTTAIVAGSASTATSASYALTASYASTASFIQSDATRTFYSRTSVTTTTGSTEQTLMSGSIPANALAPGGQLQIHCKWKVNAVSTNTKIFRIKINTFEIRTITFTTAAQLGLTEFLPFELSGSTVPGNNTTLLNPPGTQPNIFATTNSPLQTSNATIGNLFSSPVQISMTGQCISGSVSGSETISLLSARVDYRPPADYNFSGGTFVL